MELASQALDVADQELREAQEKLQILEAEMASSEPPQQSINSIEDLASSLTKVISDMRTSAVVPVEVVSEAEDHMRKLMAGVRAIAIAAAQARQPMPAASSAEVRPASPAATTSIPKRVKLIGKGPGVATNDPYEIPVETEDVYIDAADGGEQAPGAAGGDQARL